jgi:hypothetical protein
VVTEQKIPVLRFLTGVAGPKPRLLTSIAATLHAQAFHYTDEKTLQASLLGPDDIVVIIQRHCTEAFLQQILTTARVLLVADQAQIDHARLKIGDKLFLADAIVVLSGTDTSDAKTLRHAIFPSLLKGPLQKIENSCHWGFARTVLNSHPTVPVMDAWKRFVHNYRISACTEASVCELIQTIENRQLFGNGTICHAECTTDGIVLSTKFAIEWPGPGLSLDQVHEFAGVLQKLRISKLNLRFKSCTVAEISSVHGVVGLDTSRFEEDQSQIFSCSLRNLVDPTSKSLDRNRYFRRVG